MSREAAIWRADFFDTQVAALQQAKWQHEVPHRANSRRSRTIQGANYPRQSGLRRSTVMLVRAI
jgi:hypothetical protein